MHTTPPGSGSDQVSEPSMPKVTETQGDVHMGGTQEAGNAKQTEPPRVPDPSSAVGHTPRL